MSDWIKTSEQLPDTAETVLGFWEMRHIYGSDGRYRLTFFSDLTSSWGKPMSNRGKKFSTPDYWMYLICPIGEKAADVRFAEWKQARLERERN